MNMSGLSIPPDAVTLIVGVSEKLAATEPQLTFDFLSEFFIGWDKSNPRQRPLNILYMAPWLANLHQHVLMGGDDPERGRERLAVIARKIIDITVKEPKLYTSFQQNAWFVIGKEEGLLDVFLDELIKAAMNFGFDSEGAETIGSICSSFETLTIRSKVIARLRKALNRTSLRATRHLVDNHVWDEICVLLKICLAISFDCRVQAQMFLPELFHVITMVVNCGQSQVRTTVHSLLVNTVHSISTSFPLEEKNLCQLKQILQSLNEPKMCLLFSLNRPTSRDATALQEQRSENATSTSMEQITMLLLDIIQVAAPTTDMANIWRARWMSLVASTAFQSNPAIQPRAFAVMGCLAREDVDDDLLYQVLVVLRNALTRFVESGDNEMLTSIITSLTKMMDNLSPSSRYLHQLFWVAVSLVRLGSGMVFNCSAALLEATLRTLAKSGEFKGNKMSQMLLQGKSSIEDYTLVIDELYGIKFAADNFHFAMASTLTKGLQSPSTKPAALSALTAFVEVGVANMPELQRDGDIPIPPYLCMVVARAANPSDVKELLWMIGLSVEEADIDMLVNIQRIEIMSERNLLLSAVLAIIDFKTCEEVIQRQSLVLFTQMAKKRPEVLLLMYVPTTAVPHPFFFLTTGSYDHLIDHLELVVSTSHNTTLLKEANALMCAVSKNPLFPQRRGMKERLNQFLDGCGLSGIWTSTSFKSTADRESRCAALTDKLIEVSLRRLYRNHGLVLTCRAKI
jgi:neurofibromin 1